MKEYMYNALVEDVFAESFNDYYDVTDIYDRAQQRLAYTLLTMYFNLLCAFNATTNTMTTKIYIRKIIDAIHCTACEQLSCIEFMLLCDAINEINRYYNINVRVDFFDYSNIEATTYYCTTVEDYKYSSHYDFDYCSINVEAYTRQYIIEEQIYS